MARKLKFNTGDEVVFNAGGRIYTVIGYDRNSQKYKIKYAFEEPIYEPVNKLHKFIYPENTAKEIASVFSNTTRLYHYWLKHQAGTVVREGTDNCHTINFVLEDKLGGQREYAVSITVARTK